MVGSESTRTFRGCPCWTHPSFHDCAGKRQLDQNSGVRRHFFPSSESEYSKYLPCSQHSIRPRVNIADPSKCPGDVVVVSGIFLPKAFTGFKVLKTPCVYMLLSDFRSSKTCAIYFAGNQRWTCGKHICRGHVGNTE